MAHSGSVTRLGSIEEGRVQKYFCINDPDRSELPRVSKDSKVIQKMPKTIYVQGRKINGWIVELLTPATDGIVRIDPQEDSGIVITEVLR